MSLTLNQYPNPFPFSPRNAAISPSPISDPISRLYGTLLYDGKHIAPTATEAELQAFCDAHVASAVAGRKAMNDVFLMTRNPNLAAEQPANFTFSLPWAILQFTPAGRSFIQKANPQTPYQPNSQFDMRA